MGAHRTLLVLLAALALAAQPFAAAASSLDRLSQFLSGTQSGRGEFEQKVTDANGRLVQQSKGTLAFQRPGKFRWTYVKPYAQLIVGDGQKVWIHDPDLNRMSITVGEVRLSPDLKIATAYVLPLGGAGAQEALSALRRFTPADFIARVVHGLADDLLKMGHKLAETMVELFSGLPPGHE